MKFVRVETLEDGIAPLYKRLVQALEEQQRVLWLLGGGSNIPLSVAVMNQLPEDLTGKLAIYLTDERFGPVGNPDSNIQQLFDAGFIPKKAVVMPVLMPAVALQETCERYESAVKTAFENADVVIAQFGIGADGHIAGVLPGTEGVDSKKWVVGYETEQFTRISLTLQAIKQIGIAYAFVIGDNKKEALTKLHDQDLPLSEEPAQILKQLPEAYVYNDQVSDN